MNVYLGCVLPIGSMKISELSKKLFCYINKLYAISFAQKSQQPLHGKIVIENAFMIHK